MTRPPGDRIFNTIVEYAFGASDRAVTMIGRDAEGSYRAARLSSYHTADGLIWDRSVGDVPDSGSVESFRGEQIGVRDGVVRCLYCHVTQARNFRIPLTDTGAGLKRPTRGSAANAATARAKTISRRSRPVFQTVPSSTPEQRRLRRSSHNVPIVISWVFRAKFEQNRRTRISSARRCATMTASRCYTESSGSLSCLTCHDPHNDTPRPSAYFEAKCLACHTATTTPQKSCRVNPANGCLKCHMPKIPVAVLHTSMTDHYIRVHREK